MNEQKNPHQPPPKWIDRLLERFCAPELLEEVLGDLHERYYLRVQKEGVKKARRTYWREVLAYLRPSVFKRSQSYHSNHTAMFKNFFTITIRNILRHKVYSFINISGLALGISCSLLILLWVTDERKMDQFHTLADRLHLVVKNRYFPSSEIGTSRSTPGPLGEALAAEIPEISTSIRLFSTEQLFSVDDKKSKEKGIYADETFFRLMTFPLLQGDPFHSLEKPYSLVISETLAQRYFGRSDVLGETIRLENQADYQITGVMQDVPEHSSLHFEYILPIQTFIQQNDWATEWGNNYLYTYVMLHASASPKDVEDKLKHFLETKNPKMKVLELFLQPMTDTYLWSQYEQGQVAGGRISYVRLFSIVGLFILLIACINFMNLSTAHSFKRAKEIGIRRAVGAQRSGISKQFLWESLFITLIASFVALVLTAIFLPSFRQLTEKSLMIPYTYWQFWLSLVAIVVLTALLAGSYPAWYLSSLKSLQVLKGKFQTSRGSLFLRKGLVIFQFTLAIILMIGTLVVQQQIAFIQTENLGLNRENVLYVDLEGDLRDNYEVFKQDLLQSPSIKAVTVSSQHPLSVSSSSSAVSWAGKPEEASYKFQMIRTDYDFLQTLGVELVQGRAFSPAYSTDTSNYLINEEAARVMDMTDPIGATIEVWGRKGTVIGVIQDFHMASLHDPIEPLILWVQPQEANYVLARIESNRITEALTRMETSFNTYNASYPFSYHFLDQDYGQMYHSEAIIYQLITYFTLLSIVISSLGLFGLALFMAQQRRQEIGVRKTLGASTQNITWMLSWIFLKPILLAFLFSCPIAWWIMSHWLNAYAYHMAMPLWIFLVAGGIACSVALLTISYQSVRAALANPVDSLRNE